MQYCSVLNALLMTLPHSLRVCTTYNKIAASFGFPSTRDLLTVTPKTKISTNNPARHEP